MKGGSQTRFRSALQRLTNQSRQQGEATVDTAGKGFTIVEVLIVLAVTGALFISAVALISGRQNKTQFSTSINEIKTQIQQVISDVQTGFYPTSNNLICQVNGAGNMVFSSGSTSQGANSDCTFMGKVVQFGVSTTEPEQFIVYSVAGKRVNPAGTDVKNYVEAKPTVMTTNTANPTNTPTIVDTLQYGLTIVPGSLTYTEGATTTAIGSIGFLSTLADFDADRSGSQQVQLLPVKGSALNVTPAAAVASINNTASGLAASPVTPSGGVTMCFASGTTNQSGRISIGGNGRELSVTLKIVGNKTCS